MTTNISPHSISIGIPAQDQTCCMAPVFRSAASTTSSMFHHYCTKPSLMLDQHMLAYAITLAFLDGEKKHTTGRSYLADQLCCAIEKRGAVQVAWRLVFRQVVCFATRSIRNKYMWCLRECGDVAVCRNGSVSVLVHDPVSPRPRIDLDTAEYTSLPYAWL